MGNVTTYAYDTFGNLARTLDPASNQIVNVYDLRGRKTQTSDPDLGLWNYEYNALGELTKQTDAKGQATTMIYDKLGRMVQRVEPGLTSTWVYDTAAYGKGKLYQAKTSAGYVRTHSYDSLGRSIKVTSNLGTGEPTIWQSVGYDSLGRSYLQTYHTGFAVKQVYTALGYTAEVRDNASNALFWRADKMDSEGHVTQETYGNGVVTQRSYAANSGRMENIVANTAAGLQIQGQAYVYDTIGNVSIYADGPGNQLEIRGGYDALNRLTQIDSTINGVASSQILGYNALGNITSKTGVGNYAYGDPLHKHAVTAVTGGPVNLSYTYDANGNLVSGAGRAVTWTAWNMPASVTSGGVSQSWLYGPEHNRYKMVTAGRTTWYANPAIHTGGHYERTLYTSGAVEHRHTLYAGGRPIGEYVKLSGAASQTRYYHSDQQGSITAVTNEAGTVITRFRYDPWGKQTLVAGSNTGIDATRQGHTGHEMLDGGLTHMNGRLYDPVLARFVSADPHIDNPFDLQSLNRYSYVNNNPLGFTDPSGYLKIFGKKWSWWRDKVVKPVVAVVAAYVIGPYVANAIYAPLATSAAQAAAVAGTTLTYSQVATMWIGANVVGGAAAGFAAGFIASGGDVQAGLNGAIGGAIFGGVNSFYPAGKLESVVAKSLAGGVSSVAQGGSFADGFRSSLLDGSISYAWEYTRGYTDGLKLKAVANIQGEILKYNQHGELLTDGARSCVGSSAQCAGLFDNLVMAKEGEGGHRYSEYTFIGRFVNWTSKTHDFMNSWNYDQQTGGWFGRGVAFNSFYDATSFAGMLPAAVFTGYAKSLEMAPGAVDVIRRNGRY